MMCTKLMSDFIFKLLHQVCLGSLFSLKCGYMAMKNTYNDC